MRRLFLVLAGVLVAAAAVTVTMLTTGGPDEATFTGSGEHYTVAVTLDPAGTGDIDTEIRVEDREPAADAVTAVSVWTSMPSMGHAMPEIRADQIEPGRFQVRAELFTMAGTWELAVLVSGASGMEVITIDVPIDSQS